MKENKCNFVIKFIILTSQRGSKALTSSSCSTNITRVFNFNTFKSQFNFVFEFNNQRHQTLENWGNLFRCVRFSEGLEGAEVGKNRI